MKARLNRSRGLLGMQEEHLRKWLKEPRQEEGTDATHCQKVVAFL